MSIKKLICISEEKDRNDCKMIEALIENDRFKKILSRWKQSFYYGKIKVRASLINLLKSVGLFEVAKKIARSLK